MSTKIEFAVKMTCESCVKSVEKSLEGVEGIKSYNIDLNTNSVVVQTTLPAEDVLKTLETTGKKVALKGYGSIAGVAVLEAGFENIKGVVRFIQDNPNICIIDGTIDGLNPGKHRLSIHECGDITNGCSNVGEFYNPADYNKKSRIYGDLGFINTDNDGRAAFKYEDPVIKLSDIIGRSLVISDETERANLACGVIARSPGLFQNPKTICACDGVTIWKEKLIADE